MLKYAAAAGRPYDMLEWRRKSTTEVRSCASWGPAAALEALMACWCGGAFLAWLLNFKVLEAKE